MSSAVGWSSTGSCSGSGQASRWLQRGRGTGWAQAAAAAAAAPDGREGRASWRPRRRPCGPAACSTRRGWTGAPRSVGLSVTQASTQSGHQMAPRARRDAQRGAPRRQQTDRTRAAPRPGRRRGRLVGRRPGRPWLPPSCAWPLGRPAGTGGGAVACRAKSCWRRWSCFRAGCCRSWRCRPHPGAPPGRPSYTRQQ